MKCATVHQTQNTGQVKSINVQYRICALPGHSSYAKLTAKTVQISSLTNLHDVNNVLQYYSTECSNMIHVSPQSCTAIFGKTILSPIPSFKLYNIYCDYEN